MEPHLDLKEVCKRFERVVAVDMLSFAVPRGAIYGLLGPNGAGKTTTIRMIMRITLPDAGAILLNGVPMDDDARERIGYLPEERGLYRKMKVAEHLAFLAEVRGLARPEARSRSKAWLERLGLAEKANAKVEELSKGMQQKLQFAGAVIHDPEMVIFDEPFTGLDPIATRQFKDEIVAMSARGTTVVFSTHVLPQAEELCDHLCLINRGRPILQGSLAEVRARYATRALKLTSPASDAEISAAPGVAAVRTKNDTRIAELAPDAVASSVIRELAARVPIEAIEPFADSLEDIFLKAVEADHVALA